MSYVQALDWTEDNKRGYGASGYGYIYAWGKITNWQDNDDNLSFTWNVYCCGTSSGDWAGPEGYGFNLAAAWVDNNGGEHHTNGTDSYYWYGNVRSDSTNISINKTHGTQTIKLYFDHDSKTVDGYGGAPDDLLWDWRWIGTVIVSSKPSYTVSYNKNTEDEVTNLPSNQTKWYNENLSLASNIPVRGDGSVWEFIGWDSNQNAIIPTYPANQTNTYTVNNSITLYAIWKLKGHWITYNTQGGIPVPVSYLKTIGTIGYITSIVPQKDGYKFKEWNSNSNGTGTTYPAGQGYTDNANLNLYAIWEKINNKNLKIKNENRWTPVTAADFNALTYNQLNTKINNGLISAGEGHPNQIWATDTNGNPGWYSYASMFLPEFVLEDYPQNYDGTYNDTSGYHSNAGGYVGTIYLQKFGKIVCVTFNYLNMGTLPWQAGESSSSWTTQPKIILPEQFRPAYRVHVPELIRANNRNHLNFEPDGSVVLQGDASATSGFWDTIMWTTQ